MKQQLLTQQENKLVSSETTLKDITLWEILKQRNSKLISYWKILFDNGYIVFLNFELHDVNIIYKADNLTKTTNRTVINND